MVIFKVTIKPKASFQTSLKSTTLYGAICCAIADMQEYGVDILTDMVFSSNTSLVLSDAYPSGCIASPIFKDDNELSVMNIQTGEIETFGIITDKQQHCMVSRDTGMSCYLREEVISYYNKPLDFYIMTDCFNKEDIQKIIKVMLLKGVGRGKSIGRGSFELIGVEEVQDILSPELRSKQTGNMGYMVISDYIPNKTDSTLGRYTARIIRGKTIEGKQKKEVYVLNSGSSFVNTQDTPDKNVFTIGKLVKDELTGTYTNGTAIAVKIGIA